MATDAVIIRDPPGQQRGHYRAGADDEYVVSAIATRAARLLVVMPSGRRRRRAEHLATGVAVTEPGWVAAGQDGRVQDLDGQVISAQASASSRSWSRTRPESLTAATPTSRSARPDRSATARPAGARPCPLGSVTAGSAAPCDARSRPPPHPATGSLRRGWVSGGRRLVQKPVTTSGGSRGVHRHARRHLAGLAQTRAGRWSASRLALAQAHRHRHRAGRDPRNHHHRHLDRSLGRTAGLVNSADTTSKISTLALCGDL